LNEFSSQQGIYPNDDVSTVIGKRGEMYSWIGSHPPCTTWDVSSGDLSALRLPAVEGQVSNLSRSEFERELNRVLYTADSPLTNIVLGDAMREGEVAVFFWASDLYVNELNIFLDFLAKYATFLQALEDSQGIPTKDLLAHMRNTITSIKRQIVRIKDLVAESKFTLAGTHFQELLRTMDDLRKDLDTLAGLQIKIDYSRLDSGIWRMIGIPGIHYKSRVFLSYPWRDKDPKKDTNERMLNDYVKPILELLGIAPVTLRDHALPQEPIDDKAVRLIKDCDGVIGFYTKGDSILNVEREISQHPGLIGICNENGCSGPTMRRDKWQIEFVRTEMAELVIQLIKVVKSGGLFRIAAEQPSLL